MTRSLFHKAAPLLLVTQVLLSVFPTAGHFHLTGGVREDVETIKDASPSAEARGNHIHTPFTCVIHLIAASYAGVEGARLWFAPPTTAAEVPLFADVAPSCAASPVPIGRAPPSFS